MAIARTVRVLVMVPLVVAAAACVPQGGAPKAANTVSPVVSPGTDQQPAAPATRPVAATTKMSATPLPPATKVMTDLASPRSAVGTATYRCGNGGMITIRRLGSALRILGPDGAAEKFARSPANQSSRYQEAATHDAIVIDGREALVMKKGSTPQTCKR